MTATLDFAAVAALLDSGNAVTVAGGSGVTHAHTGNSPSPGDSGARSWKPWFPVIDYDRCTNCLQCLSFCLFDVYGLDEDQKIQVQNNENCKTNCPACSRVCPEVAIMFPKYAHGPINGEPVAEADLQREKMKVDISSLLGGDIYARLRDRSQAAKSRFSTERSADKALAERQRCLTKLQQDGFIPKEVLDSIDPSSLPSAEQIRAKAEKLAALQNRPPA
jgi:NAD-dependent dihydropyrimidine dehydrogenase PreA subunit